MVAMKHRPKKLPGVLARSLVAATVVCVLARPNRALAQDGSSGDTWYAQWGEAFFVGSNVPLLDVRNSIGWTSGLSVTGFLQNTSGMWADSSGLTDFGRAAGEHHGANSLSVERNLLQVDVNYFLNGNNTFFLRFW